MTSTSATPPADWQAPPAAVEPPVRLASAIQVLLVASGVTYLAVIGLEAFGLAAIGSYLAGNYAAIESLNAYDRLSIVINILTFGVLVATGVLWVVWQYRVAKQFPGRTRRSPGWHAGSWFIPIVSLVYPYQNVSDLWGAIGRARPRWLIVWWLAWVFGGLLSQLSLRISWSTTTIEALQSAMAVNILAELVSLVAVPFAVLVVRGITRGMTAAVTSRADAATGVQ